MPKKKTPTAPAGFPVVAIGASAGGLEALEAFFRAMPSDGGTAFVLVTHLDPTHRSLLPELIQKKTGMEVHQIEEGMRVQPNHVHVIPPNRSLSIISGTLHLEEFTRSRGISLPIDSFLRSLAADQGAAAACIILSGTGADGSLGVKAVKGEAGLVMVQTEDSARFAGMPRSAIATGVADYVLPPEKMPAALLAYLSRAVRRPDSKLGQGASESDGPLRAALLHLRVRTGHDFSLYKVATISRRIQRRMQLHQIDELAEYTRFLKRSDREANTLFRELLIGVTSYFRDPLAFEALGARGFPTLIGDRPSDHVVRVWVPGCSTGEEAYSMAILLQESMEATGRPLGVQIFATDLDEDSVRSARSGRFPDAISFDVGLERLGRFFIPEEAGGYLVRKSIRDTVVFAPQNILKDPPFSGLDLISCRNLLIYLTAPAQRKLISLFHYALNPDGILFLGSSETIGGAGDQFEVVDKKWKVFRKRSSTLR